MKAVPSFIIVLFVAGAHAAGLAPKEGYQPIIDAKPFGNMAAVAETDTTALVEQQKQKEEIAQKFRMCGITDMPDGTRKIAFLDETSGQAVSYLLAVGETQNGFSLVSADYEREYATLTKDGLTFTLGLGKGLIDAPPPKVEVAPSPEVTVAPTTTPTSHRRGGTFRARLLRRQAAKAEAEASERKALHDRVAEAEAEKIKAARRVQIERIKQGLAPTQPITLTREEDAELEAAGVFREVKPQQKPATPPKEGEASPESPAETARRPTPMRTEPRLAQKR